MSKTKSNVHPSHYKVAGRLRQGEEVDHVRQTALLAGSQATQDHQPPYARDLSALEQQVTAEVENRERARSAEAAARPRAKRAAAARKKAAEAREKASRKQPSKSARAATGARQRKR